MQPTPSDSYSLVALAGAAWMGSLLGLAGGAVLFRRRDPAAPSSSSEPQFFSLMKKHIQAGDWIRATANCPRSMNGATVKDVSCLPRDQRRTLCGAIVDALARGNGEFDREADALILLLRCKEGLAEDFERDFNGALQTAYRTRTLSAAEKTPMTVDRFRAEFVKRMITSTLPLSSTSVLAEALELQAQRRQREGISSDHSAYCAALTETMNRHALGYPSSPFTANQVNSATETLLRRLQCPLASTTK